MQKKWLLWDLDGTLTDPMEGITKSVQYALKMFGIDVMDRTTLCRFIGPPLKDSFMNFYGFSSEKAEEAIRYYREYFSVTGLFENTVYPGIPSLLQACREAGYSHVIATSKPEIFAREILEHFHLSQEFVYIAGSELDGTRVKKAEVIRYALKQAGITDLSGVWMIGDRDYDVIGAREVGLPCIGVTYGYGTQNELVQAHADVITGSVKELEALLLNKIQV